MISFFFFPSLISQAIFAVGFGSLSRALLARPALQFRVENSKKNCAKTGPQVKKLLIRTSRVSFLALNVGIVIKSKIEFQFAGVFLPPREDPPPLFLDNARPLAKSVRVCVSCLSCVGGVWRKVEKTTTININDSFLFAFSQVFLNVRNKLIKTKRGEPCEGVFFFLAWRVCVCVEIEKFSILKTRQRERDPLSI